MRRRCATRLRVNHAFRGLALPPGNHLVRMVFHPFSFRIGLWCSLASLLVQIGAVIWRLTRREKTVR